MGQQAAALQVVQRLDGKIRIDGAGAVSDQQREMHHLAGLAALDDDRDLGARLLPHQAIVNRGHRQQAGDRGVGWIDAAIGNDEQRIAGIYGKRSARAKVVERVLQTGLAVGSAEQCGQCGGQQVARRNTAQLFQIAIGQNGMRQLERVAVFRRLIEDVALRADVADQRHHQLFANGIDGRIGDLREELLEVVEERLGAIGQAGQRHVGSHGADRLFARGAHGREQDAQIFFAVAAGALAAQQGFGIGRDHARRLGQMIERDLLLLQPFRIRLARGQLLLDFRVGDDALLDRVDQEHAARLQAALLANVLRGNIEHAGLGGEHHQVVLGHDVAAGAKAVAVERRANDPAIGERDRSGAVPRLHQRCVVLVERALVLVHVRVAGPGFGNQHGHHVRQGTA